MKSQLPSLPIRIVLAFIPNFVVLGAAAAIFGEAVQSHYFPELAAENPNMILLAGGSLLMSILIALLYPSLKINTGQGWFSSALPIALLLGFASYFATHTVQAGYINVSATGWLLEGLYDSLAPVASILTLAWWSARQAKRS